MPNLSFTVSPNMSKPLLTDDMLITVGGIIVLENLVAMVILYRCRKLNFQVRILSMNLVLSDIFTGFILCLPLSFYHYGDNCYFKKYIAFLFLNVSLLTVSMYNLDRCFVFALGMKYYQYITKWRLVVLCILFWVIGAATSYFMFFSQDEPYKIGCRFMYELAKNFVSQSTKYLLLLIIFSNILMSMYVLHYVRRSMRQVGDVLMTAKGATNEHTRIAKKISVITISFLVVATPFYVTLTFPILNYNTKLGETIHNVSGMLLCLNSAINPVFYIWRLNEPRYHLKLLLMFWNKSYCEKLRQEHNIKSASYDIASIPENRSAQESMK